MFFVEACSYSYPRKHAKFHTAFKKITELTIFVIFACFFFISKVTELRKTQNWEA